MKRKGTNRSALFGLTQDDMAMLLQVTRSQWAYYDKGTRGLPKGKGVLALEMLKYMVSPEAKKLKYLSTPECEDTTTKPAIESRLRENEYQLLVVNRNIATLSEKIEKDEKAVELLGFLNSPEQIKKAISVETTNAMQSVAINAFKKNTSQLKIYKIDRKTLEQDKLVLEEALKECS